jgi:chlorite dismutase
MSADADLPLIKPAEGLIVMHLFYKLNHAIWQELSEEERSAGKDRLLSLLEESKVWPKFRAYTFAMLARADVGIMILAENVHDAHVFEKRFGWALGHDVLDPVYVFLSMTERSEYTPSAEDQAGELEREGLKPNTPAYDERLELLRERIEKYAFFRLYPEMPEWEYFCFYPMRKRRNPGQNWYALDFETRKKLMAGHARIGRTFSERVKQLITGATGLDDWEWGVSLFAHSPTDIKEIVYQMRFDEVSHTYSDFGPFYNGLTLPMGRLLRRLGL